MSVSTGRVRVVRMRDGRVDEHADALAVEEPLEIRLRGERVAVTMRTPGSDVELALGFLLGEGIVRPDDIASATECREDAGRVVDVHLHPGVAPSTGWQRDFYATSSCGICGKSSIDAVKVAAAPVPDGPVVPSAVLGALPDTMRAAQRVFDRTGGLHAAALFTPDGAMVILREDVGRHNAVDKVVGRAATEGMLPLHGHTLLVSGRASFEIVQKAAVAGLPILAAVSAPSSLAVDLAREMNMTLVGFLREGSFNVYTGAERISGI